MAQHPRTLETGMTNLKAVDMAGKTFCLSVNPEGSVADLVAHLYDVMWADLHEDEFEARWVDRYVAILKDCVFLNPDSALSAIPVEEGNTLNFMIRESTNAEKEDRLRKSRIRQSWRRRTLQPQELRSQVFSRDVLSRSAEALRQGRQVSGFHVLTCKIGKLEYQEERWSWTLLFKPDDQQFVWCHQQRGNNVVVEEIWASDADFLDFWSQMSEQSICAYAGLLLYSSQRDAALLEGTPVSHHFQKLISGV